MRVGFQATSTRNMVEGYGYFGDGAAGDPNGSPAPVCHAMNADGYRHIGARSINDVDPAKIGGATLPRIQAEHETLRTERYLDRLAQISGG